MFWTPFAKADPTREFFVSCTYGVLAGTIVGAAMLAFSDRPGDNLNVVARGASIGLYAGILLGLYVIYGVEDEASDPEKSEALLKYQKKSDFVFAPTLSPKSGEVDGAIINYTLLRF